MYPKIDSDDTVYFTVDSLFVKITFGDILIIIRLLCYRLNYQFL